MSTQDNEHKPVPPYLSYKTFINFINGLAETGVPMRVDRGILGHLSGSAQGHLLATLKYLNLISAEGVPNERLTKLVQTEGDERKQTLLWVLKTSYPFLFADGFDVQRATGRLMQEKFQEAGAGGATVRKCIAFFLFAAQAAGLTISPHIKAVKSGGSSTKRRSRPATNGAQVRQGDAATKEQQQPPPLRQNGSGVPINPDFGHVSKIALSGNREAIFSIPDQLSPRDAQRLKGALQGLSAIIDSMVIDEVEERVFGSAA